MKNNKAAKYIAPVLNIQSFIYATRGKQAARWVTALHETLILKSDIHTMRTLDRLKDFALPSWDTRHLFVFVFETRRGLDDCLTLQGLFSDKNTVLVLPDHAKQTIAKAYTLYPRFVAFIDEDTAATLLVIQKMLEGYSENASDYKKAQLGCK